MAELRGREAGGLYVRVGADTSGFDNEVQRAARRAQQQSRVDVPIRARVFGRDPARELDRLRESLKASAKEEQDLTRQQQRAQQQQERLTASRERALNRVSRLGEASKRAALNEERAALSLERARRRLESLRDRDESDPRRQSAQGDVDRAQLRVTSVQQRRQQLELDTGKAQREIAELDAQLTVATRDRDVDVKINQARDRSAQLRQQIKAAEDAAQQAGRVGSAVQSILGGLGRLGTQPGSGLSGVFQGLSRLIGSGPAAGIAIGVVANAIVGLIGVATLAGSSLVGLGAALAQLSGLAGAALAGISALAQAGGTVALGFSGIADAVKAVNTQQEQAAYEAPKAAKQQASSAKAIRQAQQGVADAARALADARRDAARAEEDAARRVADARRALADTVRNVSRQIEAADERVAESVRALAERQRDALRAQEDLSRARDEARQRVRELAFELRRASLSEEEAALALEEAQQRLQDLSRSSQPGIDTGALAAFRRLGVEIQSTQREVGDLERRRADLGVRQAQLSLEEARERNLETQREQADAVRRGIEGDEQVVEARERLADAQQSVRDAVRDVARAERDAREARIDGAQQIADAERAVQDAVRDAARTREDAARRVEDAQRNLARAQQGVRDAAESAAAALETSIPASARNAQIALDNLSPAGQRFVGFITDRLQPALDRLRFRAQEALLPGVQSGLEQLLTLEPLVGTAVDATGAKLGELAQRGAALVTSGPWRQDFQTITAGNIQAIDDLGGTIFNAADAARILTAEGQPLLLRLTGLAEQASASAVGFLEQKRASGELAAFYQAAGDRLEQLGRIGRDVFIGLVNNGQVFLPLGELILDIVERGAGAFRRWSENLAASEGTQRGIALIVETIRNAYDRLFEALQNNEGELRLLFNAFLQIGGYLTTQFINGITFVVDGIGDMTRVFVGFVDSTLRNLQNLAGAGASIAGALGLDSTADRLRSSEQDFRTYRDNISTFMQDTAGAAEGSAQRQEGASQRAREAQRQYAEQVRQESERIRGSLESQIPPFQEIGEQAQLTSDQVLGTLRANRDRMQEFSETTRELLRRGVDPAVVQELAQQGPQYIAAFKDASDEELAELETIFGDRTRSATEAADAIAGAGGSATGLSFGEGVRSTLPQVDRSFLDAINGPAASSLLGDAPSTARLGGEATGLGFSNSLGNQAFKAKEAGGLVAGDAQGGLNPAVAGAGGIGGSAGAEFAAQLRLQQFAAQQAGQILYEAQKNALRASIEASAGIGRDSGSRYAGGAREQQGAAQGAGGGLAGSLAQGMRDAFESLKETGRSAAKRVIEGFADIANKVRGVGSAFGRAVGGALGDGLGGALPAAPYEGGPVGSGSWQSIASFVGSSGVPHRITSTVRPGARTSTGRLSRHATGNAVDFAAPRPGDSAGLLRIWAALTRLGGLRELIYSPAPYQILGGRAFPGPPSNSAIRRQHYDHVHAAFDRGGLITEPVLGYGLRTGMSYSIAERGPEFVTSRRDTAKALASGVTIGSITVQVGGANGGSPEQVAQRVASTLVRELNRKLVQAGGR